MKIAVYCQHVLGIGHFIRTLALCRALHRHDLLLITGGEPVDISLPGHVAEVRLPSLMMDTKFRNLHGVTSLDTLERIKTERTRILWALFEQEAPDLLLVELYPFGRKAFRFELDPLLEGLRSGGLPSCRVLCSVRDILVEKEKAAAHEARAVDRLNRFFDGVLVHADPRVITLDRTFDLFEKIKIPVVYTGYVTDLPSRGDPMGLRRQLGLNPNRKLVVVSAGGGRVGGPLFRAVAAVPAHLSPPQQLFFLVFGGPFVEDDVMEVLQRAASPLFHIERFASDFTSYLSAADLSISMAGYNTCMNILSTGVPALVLPFDQNREQGLRAGRLSELGALDILSRGDLDPPKLARLIEGKLNRAPSKAVGIDLNGAANTAAWIEQGMKSHMEETC